METFQGLGTFRVEERNWKRIKNGFILVPVEEIQDAWSWKFHSQHMKSILVPGISLPRRKGIG